MYVQYIQGLFQSRLGTADYALDISSLHSNDSLVTWIVIHMTAAKFKPLIFGLGLLKENRDCVPDANLLNLWPEERG
jgi:hypothetical protein